MTTTFYTIAGYVNRHLEAGSRPDQVELATLVTSAVHSDPRVTACIPWAITHGPGAMSRESFLEEVASRVTHRIWDRVTKHLDYPEYYGPGYRASGDILSDEAAGIASVLTDEVAVNPGREIVR